MGTHPIFESDFDCLTDIMVDITEEGDEETQKPIEESGDDDSDLEQFYDALETKLDANNEEESTEVKWAKMMGNLDQRIEKANHAKLKGTEFFKLDSLALAESHYLDALAYLPDKDLVEARAKSLEKDTIDEPAGEVRSILHGNLSAVQKRDNRLKEAIENASEALRLNETYLKVRVRRAELYEENDQPHESLEDWKRVLEADAENRAAKVALARLPAKIEIKNEKLKAEMFDGMKKLGNMCLKPFGLSTENFKLEQNESGSYNVNFQQ